MFKKKGIYTGLLAKLILRWLLRHETPYPWPRVMGMYADRNLWIVFDNTDSQCFVEEFHRRLHAIQYLKNPDMNLETLNRWDAEYQHNREIEIPWDGGAA